MRALITATAISVALICGSCTRELALCPPQEALTAPPAGADAFYGKYLNSGGISILASANVSDEAFYRMDELMSVMLAQRPDVRRALIENGFSCVIIGKDEQVTDIPEYSHMRPKDYWNARARGFGGTITSCGEENLLELPQDRYKGENIFIHEFAHSFHRPGLTSCESNFQSRLDALYKEAIAAGLYEGDYAATNSAEYWAEAVQAYFDCDRENDSWHNHVNTRAELEEYDPKIAALIAESFRIDESNDWRYKPYRN